MPVITILADRGIGKALFVLQKLPTCSLVLCSVATAQQQQVTCNSALGWASDRFSERVKRTVGCL
jgi:hypothetical protein